MGKVAKIWVEPVETGGYAVVGAAETASALMLNDRVRRARTKADARKEALKMKEKLKLLGVDAEIKGL